jgi:hypothetical protein
MQSKDSHMMNEPTRRRMLIALACCGAAGGITALAAVRSVIRSRATAESLRLATDKARPHIDKAVAESRAGIDEQLATIDAFFDRAKANAGGFADDMLGWTSK